TAVVRPFGVVLLRSGCIRAFVVHLVALTCDAPGSFRHLYSRSRFYRALLRIRPRCTLHLQFGSSTRLLHVPPHFPSSGFGKRIPALGSVHSDFGFGGRPCPAAVAS